MSRIKKAIPPLTPASSFSTLRGQPPTRVFRVLASGTLFMTYTLNVSSSISFLQGGTSSVRAKSVQRSRGGSAVNMLAILSQLGPDEEFVEANLIAPVSASDEGKALLTEINELGVETGLCRHWESLGVPSAWVIDSEAAESRTVINHNPIPEISHEEFVTLLGHRLVPENYVDYDSPHPPNPPIPPRNAPPFDWIHFEGRSAKTTLTNMEALDGLARERGWRHKCVFSLDIGQRGKQGVEALIPHADVIFFSKAYALSQNYTTPRPFLLSLLRLAKPHALLVTFWGSEGSALLSVPTKEYLQGSGWEGEDPKTLPAGGGRRQNPPKPKPSFPPPGTTAARLNGIPTAHYNQNGQPIPMPVDHESQLSPTFPGSVRSGSNFYADGRASSGSEGLRGGFDRYMAALSQSPTSPPIKEEGQHSSGDEDEEEQDADDDDDKTEGGKEGKDEDGDETADDAFIAGMIWALGRTILPGAPYAPVVPVAGGGGGSSGVVLPSRSAGAAPHIRGSPGQSPYPPPPGANANGGGTEDGGKWRLEECLRFATELAGRKVRMGPGATTAKTLSTLRQEMQSGGWFD